MVLESDSVEEDVDFTLSLAKVSLSSLHVPDTTSDECRRAVVWSWWMVISP